ncbi:MAG: hypothetical protein ACUVUE_06375 [Candidatus Bathycorpusculaceae bacterium]
MSPQLLVLLVFMMELVSSFISILVGYEASKGYKVSSAKGFLFLYLGFIILGVGIFLRAITATFFVLVIRTAEAIPSSIEGLSNFAGIIFTVTQLVAYSLFVVTYTLQAKSLGQQSLGAETTIAAAFFPVARLFYIPTLELLVITMLGFVAVSLLMNWLHHRNSISALVFLGFGFMLFSHILFLFMVFEELLLFFGQIMQLVGFLCLLIMLAKVNRTRA